MKKLLLGLLLCLFLVTSASATTYVVSATALTGGGTGALDRIECEDVKMDNSNHAITTGSMAITVTPDKEFYVHRYNATGTDSEDSPYIIVPDDRADCSNQGQWELVARSYAAYGLLTFAWDASTGIDGYRLYRSDTSGVYIFGAAYAVAVFDADATIDIEFDIPDGTWYWVLTAFDGELESDPSNEVTATLSGGFIH